MLNPSDPDLGEGNGVGADNFAFLAWAGGEDLAVRFLPAGLG